MSRTQIYDKRIMLRLSATMVDTIDVARFEGEDRSDFIRAAIVVLQKMRRDAAKPKLSESGNVRD
jgi:Arc/MetJ-type ribon-helix-helix transcriptional regulator